MTKHVGETFKMSPVRENEVARIIENSKDSAVGWVDLRPNVMKRIKDCIKIPHTHINNLSFVYGIFPSELIRANVVPLFKSGEDFVFTNYLPVSILPVFSKLIER